MFCSGLATVDNHLSGEENFPLDHAFNSASQVPRPYVWVARLRGLPRSNLTVSSKSRLFGTFTEYSCISKDLALSSAVRHDTPTLVYCFTKHKHYGHRSPCEHGFFPHDTKGITQLSKNCFFISLNYEVSFKLLHLKHFQDQKQLVPNG